MEFSVASMHRHPVICKSCVFFSFFLEWRCHGANDFIIIDLLEWSKYYVVYRLGVALIKYTLVFRFCDLGFVYWRPSNSWPRSVCAHLPCQPSHEENKMCRRGSKKPPTRMHSFRMYISLGRFFFHCVEMKVKRSSSRPQWKQMYSQLAHTIYVYN